jgi:hypothetical protein
MTTTLADNLHDVIHEALKNVSIYDKEDTLYALRGMIDDMWEEAYDERS